MKRRLFLKLSGISAVPACNSKSSRAVLHCDSLQLPRLDRMPERIYAEEWKRVNKRRAYINNGYAALELILCPSGQDPPLVSKRDAEVAASVIQWLGTACGLSFVSECERKIRLEQGSIK